MSTMSRIVPVLARFTPFPSAKILHSMCRCNIEAMCWANYSSCRLMYGRRCYSTEKENKSSLTEVKSKEIGAAATFEQVKETTKTVSYLGVIVVGVGVTGIMFFAVFQELFSSKSPNSVYSAALDKCCNEPRILNALGDPIKGFGEETRRGRRRHVSHLLYEKDGINYLRMKFYIQGSRRRGTVHLEMRENDKGKYEYRYLFVQLDDYPRDTIILEDNRYDVPSDDVKTFETL
ncbi:mitochondrial import inner membrane translocase subunit Tim21 [Anabrus simplex]|uniref:mitochondrial import inner membrane translocase subunit Tim21 n=1 Tax=Anabrus simplex TaxID=316456 RepID=UPI0035A2E6AD